MSSGSAPRSSDVPGEPRARFDDAEHDQAVALESERDAPRPAGIPLRAPSPLTRTKRAVLAQEVDRRVFAGEHGRCVECYRAPRSTARCGCRRRHGASCAWWRMRSLKKEGMRIRRGQRSEMWDDGRLLQARRELRGKRLRLRPLA